LPEWGTLENYTDMVEKLPLTNSPAVFGLHPNAEIGYFTTATKSMWWDLINLQPRTSGSGEGISREEYITNMARDVLGRVPEQTDLDQVRKGFKGVPTPEEVVLLQELERFNFLSKKMTITLVNLQRALVGEIGMDDELDALGDALFNGFLPASWRRLCPSTQKPLGSWMSHFTRRQTQYMKWVDEGTPTVMWVSGLHIPESFLTALVQSCCRLKNWPLDKSTLYTKVSQYTEASQVKEQLATGCYAQGLYLDGAAWDLKKGRLRKQDPKVLITNLPLLQVIPIEASKLKLQNVLRTPVYVTQDRANAMGVGMVFEADLTTFEHPSHWVLQGVALCLNTDE